jgi:hypothetical protein
MGDRVVAQVKGLGWGWRVLRRLRGEKKWGIKKGGGWGISEVAKVSKGWNWTEQGKGAG